MKRAAVSNSSGPRRSKRLANNHANNSNNNVAVKDALPSVVSISSNEDTSNNNENDNNNNMKPPAVRKKVNANFPQDAITRVDSILPFLTEYLDEAGLDSDESEDSNDRTLQYIQVKEPVFRILKFALSEKSFIGKDDEARHCQAELMDKLLSTPSIFVDSSHNNALGIVGTFMEILIARGDILPPKSLFFLQRTDDMLLQEIDGVVAVHEDDETLLHERFQQYIIQKGDELVDSIDSRMTLYRYLLRDDPVKMERTTQLIHVLKSIVQLWIHLLQDATWNASPPYRFEQLENVYSAFSFCKMSILAVELKTLDVKTVLWKLVLFGSFAMDSPGEMCCMEQRQELQRLAKIVRR